MDRILRGTAGTVQITLYDASGNPINVSGGASATVRDSAGIEVAGSPFATTNPDTGIYRFTWPSTLEVLDVYDLTWALGDGTTRRTQLELVGSHLFTQAELRAYDAALGDEAAYPDALLREVRDVVTERFATVAEVSFTLRGRREWLDGSGTDRLILGEVELRRVAQIKVDDVALTAEELAEVKAYPFGMIAWVGGTFATGLRNVEVLYEHGMVEAPAPVTRAAWRFAKHVLTSQVVSALDERATAMFNEVGGFRLTLAGRDGPTGLPEVDAVLSQFGRRRVGFA